MFPQACTLSFQLSSSVWEWISHFDRGFRHKGFHSVGSRRFKGFRSMAWTRLLCNSWTLLLTGGICWLTWIGTGFSQSKPLQSETQPETVCNQVLRQRGRFDPVRPDKLMPLLPLKRWLNGGNWSQWGDAGNMSGWRPSRLGEVARLPSEAQACGRDTPGTGCAMRKKYGQWAWV